MVHPELKKAIIAWLFDNANLFNRHNACVDHFRQYIYGPDGNHIIGGEDVYDFIKEVGKLI